ncbi:BTAD domain-containing putative transcriptional regulator [Lachnotalea sp. AF33-28]|jgi:DNA-binding SARP family transcriptional activator|uniref:BTAD domain-containing putative transcriptional regulator n=1 Tax=Lachnotalea sp. AF33-28 TaxID=2292046 RepID=UPI000E4BB0BB|nr:BTAD domain-containing putative transcriptional regulator [Lachnotalea sp. AF33-28]RHP36243.1 hypothetical protein DWZ56_00890 [Lachnotalea sp. AF33-28]
MKTSEENNPTNEKIIVNLFGQFQVISSKGVLNEDNIRSEMVAKLLAYLLSHHGSIIPVQELSDAMWSEDETENPVGALKNLAYRLRNVLKEILGESNYILTGRGSYYWNPEIPVYVDAEEFEEYCRRAKSGGSLQEQTEWYENAVELYQGDFLPKQASEHWVIPVSTYYHTLFLDAAKALAGLYELDQQYDKMASVCSKAIEKDGLDEQLHCLFIKALVGQNKHGLALAHYSKATAALYENLGTKPSKELQEVYQDLLKSKNELETDLSVIQSDLSEEAEPEGVFLCEYGVFRQIYRLEVRRSARLGLSEYVLLLTVTPKAYVSQNSDTYLKVINDAMEQLKGVLNGSLRIGDVASRYSGSQYVVMLPTCTFESAEMVTNRILTRFYALSKYPKVNIQFSLEEISLSRVVS